MLGGYIFSAFFSGSVTTHIHGLERKYLLPRYLSSEADDTSKPKRNLKLDWVFFLLQSQKKVYSLGLQKKVQFPPSFELGTSRVLGERDDHYTTETTHLYGCCKSRLTTIE